MREKSIEQKLVKAVKARGGICPKLAQALTGCPTAWSSSHMGGWALWK